MVYQSEKQWESKKLDVRLNKFFGNKKNLENKYEAIRKQLESGPKASKVKFGSTFKPLEKIS